MANPLAPVLDLAHGLLLRVKDMKRNRDEGQLLGSLAEQTLATLQGLEDRVFDWATSGALERIKDALQEAQNTVDKCRKANFIYALLYHESYATELKRACGNLDHALAQIPVAALGMTADIQTDVVALSSKIRDSKFDERATVAHHAMNVKEAVERASNRSGRENAEIKDLVQQVLRENGFKFEGIKQEMVLLQRQLELLKQKGDELKEEEERKRVFELEIVIGVLSQSLAHGSRAPDATTEWEDKLRCPISKEIMRDPVMLKESDMIYDRPSITSWLEQGHGCDPVTNVVLKSKDLVPVPVLRIACQIILKRFGAQSSTINTSQGEDSQQSVELGLYEGQGKLLVGPKMAYASQLLLFEPNGGVVGLTLYNERDYGDQENKIELGAGQWDGSMRKLSFVDNRYNYHGIVERLNRHAQRELKWNTNASSMDHPAQESMSTLFYSPPFKGPTGLLCPTILQCEGNVDTTTSHARYKSKLVLSLEDNSIVRGWTYFESSMQETGIVGHIEKGTWDDNGCLILSISFSSNDATSNDATLNSDSMPPSYANIFEVMGFVTHDESHSFPIFRSLVTEVKTEGIPRSNKKPTPLNGLRYWECTSLHEVSIPWHHLHPNSSKLFQLSRSALDLELERSQCNLTANVHLEHPLGSQVHHELRWSSLHIASANNSISTIRELIANGADVNQQQRGGHTPLHLASLNDHIDAIQELIGNGANIDLQDSIGRTALHIASKRGQVSIVRILLDRGASKEVRNVAGMTAYDFVCVGRCLLPFGRSTIEELKAMLET